MKSLIMHPDTARELERQTKEGSGDLTMLKMRYVQAKLFMGYRIVETKHCPRTTPKIQIDPHFKWCSPAFRSEMDRWLAERFGGNPVVYVTGGI